jgi:hypothetical protein
METDDEDEGTIRLRCALAVALLGLDLLAKGILRPEDATRTLDVIEKQYGYNLRNP